MPEMKLREDKNKCMVFVPESANRKYWIKHRILYDDAVNPHWEVAETFDTLFEAERYYRQMPDLLIERNFEEYFEMYKRREGKNERAREGTSNDGNRSSRSLKNK